MRFIQNESKLIAKNGNETLLIEPWGKDSLRVRATQNPDFSGELHALSEVGGTADIKIGDSIATITNGDISAEVNFAGVLSFFHKGKLILREYYRSYGGTISKESRCLKIVGREMKGLAGNDWRMTVRFESNDGEKLFGMGQYQQPYLDPTQLRVRFLHNLRPYSSEDDPKIHRADGQNSCCFGRASRTLAVQASLPHTGRGS